MDYYSLKRKQLQSLCKKHNIPANSATSILADKLTQLLNEKQKPTTRKRACLKSPVETAVEGEPVVSKREAKKVRFSPNNDLLEYELRSGRKQKDVVVETKGRRKSVGNKVDSEKKKGKKAAKDVEKVADEVKEHEVNVGKVTRSKAHTLNKGAVVQIDETKQNKRGVKDVEKTNEPVGGDVVGRVRVTRSKAQSMMEDGIGFDVNPQLTKSSRRRVAKDADSVEPSREIADIPVRVTRTRGQILKEDIWNTVTNQQGEKKRTRKEMKSTDLRTNSSNIAPDDNQELPKRKSLRSRGVETADKDEAGKLGCGKQNKRGKESVTEVPESQHHADKGSRQLRRNVAKVEVAKVLNQKDSKVEIISDRRVTRSKHQKDSKVVQQPDEPLDHGEKKVVNRRTSVVQKAQGKGIDKPLVGKTRSKEQSGNLPLIDEGSKDIKKVTRSGKDASENEIEAVVNPTGSPKSRKRRGTPFVEDQTVETEHESPVDKSPRHSAPSSSKSEGKSVAKKQMVSSLTTPASRKSNQLVVQNAFPEVNKENSSKKRAKLSGTYQRYSHNNIESSVKGTPVSKMGSFELDEEVTETENTPAIESQRRVTRSVIRTVGKEPSQSAIQDQPIGDAQLSSRKVARFRTNPAVNTAPGRVTRSGIKHGGKAAIIFSENVDKKKQRSRSAIRKQPYDDTQNSSPEGAEVGLNPDVDTIGVQSEISKASESTIVPEENMVSIIGTAVVMEKLSPMFGENASGVESDTISNVERIPVTMAEGPEVNETTPDAVSDGAHAQNETHDVSFKNTIFIEADIHIAVNSEKPVADESEMDFTKLGSSSKGLQSDLMAEEPAISVDKTVVIEEKEAGSSSVCHVSVEQSGVKGKLKEMEDQVEPLKIENVTQSIEDDGSYAQIAKGFEQDDLTCKDSLQNDSVDKHEVTDNGEGENEDQSASVQKPLMNKPVSEDRGVADVVDAQKMDEGDNKEEIIVTGKSVNENDEFSSDKSVVNCSIMDRSVEFEVVPSTDNNVHEVPIFCESDGKEDIVPAAQSVAEHDDLTTGNDVHEIPIFGGSDGKEAIVSAGQGVTEHGELPTESDVHEIAILGESGNKEDILSAGQSVAEHGEMASGVHEIPIFDESDNKEEMVTSGRSVAKHGELLSGENVIYEVDAGNVPTKKLEFDVVPSTGNDVHEVPIMGKSDGEDEGAHITKEGEIDLMPLTDGDMLEDGSDGDDGGASAIACDTDSLPTTADNKFDDSLLSGNKREDGSASAMDCQIDSLPSTSGNMIEVPVLSNEINVEADGATNVPKELETGLEPANVPDSINDVSSDFENDRLTSNDSHAMDDQNVGGEDSEPALNENTPVVTEVSVRYCDQEPEQQFNIADNEVPCDTVEICASVGPSDSLTNIEAPHTHGTAAITVDPLEESILDINKEAVSNILADTYNTDTENDSGNVQKFSALDEGIQPKESEIFPPDMSKEQTSETAEMTTGNDQEKQTVATVDLVLDGGKLTEECSNHGVEELDSELVGILNSDENPTREQNSPIVQSKEHSSHVMGDIEAHESTIAKGSPQITYTRQKSPRDGKDSDLPIFFKEDGRNKQGSNSVDWGDYDFEMDDFHNQVTANESDDVLNKDRKEFPTSAGASSSGEENFRVAAVMVDSVKNLETASINMANEKSSQEIDTLEENVNADMTQEVFNWPDSSPWPMDSLGDFDGETQPNATTHCSENVTYGIIEDYSHKFFGNDSSDDGSGKDKHFELKGEQVDQIKQCDLSSDAVGSSRHQASDLKDNSIPDELKKEEETQPKGPEPFDDLDFDKGI